MTAHLHLVREKEPDIRPPEGFVFLAYCQGCKENVFVIHLNRPPEDPPEREGQIR